MSLRLTASNASRSATFPLSLYVLDPRPRASIRISPSPAYTGQTIVAEASATGRPPFSYRWKLSPEGVGSTSPTFSWSSAGAPAGLRSLELTLSNAAGSQKVTRSFRLQTPPLILSFAPICPNLCFFPPGSTVSFELRTSESPAPARFEYDWEGDGRFDDSSSSPLTAHTFPKAGHFRPRVRVSSGRTETAFSGRYVHITSSP